MHHRFSAAFVLARAAHSRTCTRHIRSNALDAHAHAVLYWYITCGATRRPLAAEGEGIVRGSGLCGSCIMDRAGSRRIAQDKIESHSSHGHGRMGDGAGIYTEPPWALAAATYMQHGAHPSRTASRRVGPPGLQQTQATPPSVRSIACGRQNYWSTPFRKC